MSIEDKIPLKSFSTTEKIETSYVFPLSEGKNPKRVTVSKFKGKVRIDLREFYSNNDEFLPGKKGINLDIEQFEEFKKLLPIIDEAIKQFGK